MIVTELTYRDLTGDNDSSGAAASAWIERATSALEDELGRPLESLSRSERMFPDQRGYLYPLATPVQSATGYTIIDTSTIAYGVLGGVWPDLITATDYVTVTYIGGYVERSANPTAANRLPVAVEYDICIAAYRIGHTSAADLSAIPAGATSVSLGDASVSFGNGAPSGGIAAILRGAWSHESLRLRRRRL